VFHQIAPAIPSLLWALQRTESDEVIKDIAWGLSFFTQRAADETLQCLTESGVVPRLIQLTHHSEI